MALVMLARWTPTRKLRSSCIEENLAMFRLGDGGGPCQVEAPLEVVKVEERCGAECR